MEIGMAAFKLSVEADRLIAWMKQFKPEQTHLTFPNQFGGQPIAKLLLKFATQEPNGGKWMYQGFECRFPTPAEPSVKPAPTAGTRDDPHRRGENIAHLARDGAR